MNIPLLPDKSYKLLIVFGAFIVAYFWNNINDLNSSQLDKVLELSMAINKIQLDDQNFHESTRALLAEAESLLLNDEKIKLHGDEMILKLTKKHNEAIARQDTISSIGFENEKLQIFSDKYESTIDLSAKMINIGLFMLVGGFLLWNYDEFRTDYNLKKNQLGQPQFSPVCQSCGLKFNSMVRYGTNEDDTKNYHFCSECYNHGEFTDSDITKEDMKERIGNRMKSYSLSDKEIALVHKRIDKLDRWNFNY